MVAYGCGVEWECGRVTDYMNTRFLWGMMKTKDCSTLKIVGDCWQFYEYDQHYWVTHLNGEIFMAQEFSLT